jgi:hypothetical protein
MPPWWFRGWFANPLRARGFGPNGSRRPQIAPRPNWEPCGESFLSYSSPRMPGRRLRRLGLRWEVGKTFPDSTKIEQETRPRLLSNQVRRSVGEGPVLVDQNALLEFH